MEPKITALIRRIRYRLIKGWYCLIQKEHLTIPFFSRRRRRRQLGHTRPVAALSNGYGETRRAGGREGGGGSAVDSIFGSNAELIPQPRFINIINYLRMRLEDRRLYFSALYSLSGARTGPPSRRIRNIVLFPMIP